MNTKKCKKCGWEYPLITPYASCRFCGTLFSTGICKRCGEYSEDIVPNSGQSCRSCCRKRKKDATLAYLERAYKDADNQFEEWLKRLAGVSTHSLTEQEWLDAVNYFGGCALCGSESVDARGYFIAFKDGGRYNKCNVIPLCEKCAMQQVHQRNPFRRLHTYLNRDVALKQGITKENFERVVGYLQHAMGETDNDR